MHAFDFVMTLYSFVYALGVAHILACVGDIIRAGKRVRFSWLNAAWMLNALLLIVSWWLALWDLRGEKTWTMPSVLFFFLMSCLIYVLARLVSPPIPHEGPVDLQAYHREEGWKYGSTFSAIVALTIGLVYAYGSVAQSWVSENKSNWPTLAAALAATLSKNRWVQTAAVLVVYAVWIWYFATLQGALVDSP
jgi:hypothetical protein